MSHADTAKINHERHFNCAQAVFSTYAAELGLERDQALKVASAFGGGMGRMGGTCGAITGAYMAISLKYGMVDPADQAAKEKTYAVVQAFAQQFKERFGGLDCRDLLGVDLSTPEGFAFAREQGLFTQRCALFIEAATEILDERLLTP